MKKNCFNCVYGGCCFPKYNNVVPCKNDNVKKKEILYDCRPYQDKTEIKMVVENNAAKSCEYFIPHIELKEEDIELEVSVNVSHKCPYCGNEDTEYNENSEDSKIIECPNCGNKYKISWCYER